MELNKLFIIIQEMVDFCLCYINMAATIVKGMSSLNWASPLSYPELLPAINESVLLKGELTFFDIVDQCPSPTLWTIILKLLRIPRTAMGKLAKTKTPVRDLGILSSFRMLVH